MGTNTGGDAATYSHTQYGGISPILGAIALLIFAGAYLTGSIRAIAIILGLVGVLMSVFALAFHQLTVSDAEDRLAVQFGPLPLFRKTIRYADMRAIEAGQTTVIEGWGIHLSPRGGWVWNLWGRGCVIISLPRGVFIVGTDDPEGLAAFLRTKVTNRGPSVTAR